MPASSKKQQHFMAMVHSLQKGTLDTSSLPTQLVARLRKAAESMSAETSGDFARAVRESKLSFSQFVVLTSQGELE